MNTNRLIMSGCWLLIFSLVVSFSIHAQSSSAGKKKPKPHHGDCAGNCFSTEVVSAHVNEDCCTEYTLKVSHDGTCRYDLSHFTVALPCGKIESLSNSRGWKQEIGKDPTTGLRGFKIDDISNFGKDYKKSFTVNVKVCGDSSCLEKINVVAYKAGQCVDYDTLAYNATGGCGNPGGGDSTCSTLTASMKVRNATCFGTSDGELEVDIEDGREPFTYRWSNGTSDSIAQNLRAGIYFVTIKDADGNVLTLSKEITQPPAINLSQTLFNPSCAGAANGFIDISVSGGSGSYSYLWSSGATTQDISNLNAGTYTVTVTDSVGCAKQASYLLVNNVRISLGGVVTKTSCSQPTGAINATVSGGTAPYTYSWNNGVVTEDLTNIDVGIYRLTVTDANECNTSSTFVVSENNTLSIAFGATPAGCFNETTGAIDITASGGTAPYTYSWQHGPSTADLSDLASGLYRVTVTDNTGCSVQSAINVPKKLIQVNAQIIQPLCYGDSTGSVVIIPIDGTTTYVYQWSNGGTTNSITNVPIGNYTLTITDASGCSRTLSYSITQPSAISGNAVINNNQCGAEGSFSIDLSVSGGKTPYTYLWSTGAVTQDIQNLNSGTFSVLIKDANGCMATKEVMITPASDSYACTINPITTPLICGSAGNTITSLLPDAQTYQWSVSSTDNSWAITIGNSSTAVFKVGNAGTSATFSLTILKNGCTKTCTYQVSTSCQVRDNNGGGDPSTSDPCADSSVVVNPPHSPGAGEPGEEGGVTFEFSAYPNPFSRSLTFEWIADKDDKARLVILDPCGRVVARIFSGDIVKGEKYTVSWEVDWWLRERMYFYQFTSSTQVERGKVFRKY